MVDSSQECLLPSSVQALSSRISADGRVMYEQMRTGRMKFAPGTPNSPTPRNLQAARREGARAPSRSASLPRCIQNLCRWLARPMSGNDLLFACNGVYTVILHCNNAQTTAAGRRQNFQHCDDGVDGWHSQHCVGVHVAAHEDDLRVAGRPLPRPIVQLLNHIALGFCGRMPHTPVTELPGGPKRSAGSAMLSNSL